MSIVQRSCIILLTVAAVTGCSTMYQGYSVKPIDMGADSPYLKLTQALQAKSGDNPPLIAANCFASSFTDAALSANCTSQRNMAVAALVIASDEACLAHRRSMYGQEAAWNIGLGTLTNIFAGAASVVSAERAKSVLAALALFSNSERSLVNETIYKQMLVTAVDKKIVETRDDKMRTIYSSLKNSNVAAYSVHEALRDVIVLHNSCSFIDGLEKALQEGTQDTATLKIARLRSNLMLLKTERSLEKDAASAQAIGLDDRITAINAALKTEELR